MAFLLPILLLTCSHSIASLQKNMEFRVFLPRLTPLEAKSSFSHAKYDAVLSNLISSFGDLNGSSLERRDDIYLIGGCHFGVKFRAGKKLEIKIRLKKLNFNIEHWKKVKLGKKSLNHYRSEIVTLLQEESDQPQPEDAELIKAEKYFTVQKARSTQLFGEVSKEICFISSTSDPRNWLSFAVEGSLEDIQNFLSSKVEPHSDLNYLLEALHISSDMARRDPALLPVVAGYPTWIRIASNHSRGIEEFNEVLSSVDSFLSSLTFVPSSTTDVAVDDTTSLISQHPSVATQKKKSPPSEERPTVCFGFC